LLKGKEYIISPLAKAHHVIPPLEKGGVGGIFVLSLFRVFVIN